MSETTKIEWATSTGNPWIGCTKVSPGCKHCYAETLDKQRFSRTMGGGTKENPVSHWGKGAPRFRTKQFWKDAVKWNKAQAAWRNQPCDPKFRPAVDAHPNPRIFPSLCDWIDEEVPIEWLADFLKLVYETPNLDWLLLTKRPKNFWGKLEAVQDLFQDTPFKRWLCCWGNGLPPSNVWIGTSVEDQQRADERIPELLKIPARVRFLSVEPLLGPVDLRLPRLQEFKGILAGENHSLHWVIVGGESGPGARPCDTSWIRSIVSQCKIANVPVFVKQLGSKPYYLDVNCTTMDVEVWLNLKHPKGGDMGEWPADLQVREFPIH